MKKLLKNMNYATLFGLQNYFHTKVILEIFLSIIVKAYHWVLYVVIMSFVIILSNQELVQMKMVTL